MSHSVAEPERAETVVAKSATDWEKVNELTYDFADGIIRELGMLAGEHVDATGVAFYEGFPRLVVHAQMQGIGGTSARLEFAGIRKLGFDYDLDVSPAIAEDVAPGLCEVRVLGLRVTAERCTVAITGAEGLGEGPFVLQS